MPDVLVPSLPREALPLIVFAVVLYLACYWALLGRHGPL